MVSVSSVLVVCNRNNVILVLLVGMFILVMCVIFFGVGIVNCVGCRNVNSLSRLSFDRLV